MTLISLLPVRCFSDSSQGNSPLTTLLIPTSAFNISLILIVITEPLPQAINFSILQVTNSTSSSLVQLKKKEIAKNQ